MAIIDSSNPRALDASVWRDLGLLAAEALAIGLVFSVLMALAVFVIARGAHGDEFAAAPSAVSTVFTAPGVQASA
jgi:hypothetical protein